MHLPLKQSAFILTLLFGALLGAANAQTLTVPVQASTTGSSAVDFEFRADGTLIAKSLAGPTANGAGTGTLLSTDQGAGTRMLWFPAYAAFRAGYIDNNGTEWNQSNIGLLSSAFGWDTIASGGGSFATGDATVASGGFASAFGGASVASGAFATAFNGSTASGAWSSSFGLYDTASGTDSLAVGTYNTAGGWASMTSGHQNYAGGTASYSGGFNDWTQADYSAVFWILERC